ncbi:MAG: rod shape-determining protein, partial [Chloroflexi bacterium]|nr:rod shape-determining protein [Chloroflexota bacterium]
GENYAARTVATAPAGPHRGGTLTVILNTEPNSIGYPPQILQPQDYLVADTVVETLAHWTAKGGETPWLATAWKSNPKAKTVTVTSWEITQALSEPLSQIVAAVRSVLEATPPELASDVIDRGMVLTGGGALLRNIDRLLAQETGVPCHIAPEPEKCVAIGAGLALEHLDVLRRSLPTDDEPLAAMSATA